MSDSNGLSKFIKMEKIGEGSFGEVFKAMDEETNEIYAIKIFNNEFNKNSADYLSVLFREVELFSKFNHPSILPFVTFSYFGFDDEQRPAIVTKFAPNGSLEQIIQLEKRNPFVPFWDNTKILCNIYGIASAVAYLHAHDVAHLDLKPANILLDEYLFPLICDFGLSKVLDKNRLSLSMSTSTGFRGTITHMAPEIITDKKYSTSCDTYSFALVLFSIFTNEEPFTDIDIFQFITKIIHNGERPKMNSKIPEPFKKLITKCWSENPDDRPTFDWIVTELAENPEYLIDGVDTEKYHKYIELINRYQATFDMKNEHNKQEDIMKDYFEKVDITDIVNKKSEIDLAFENLFTERINELKKLPLKKQETIKNIIFCENKKVNFYQIHIESSQLENLHKEDLLNSPYLVNILKFFKNISVDIQFPSNDYTQIIEVITNIKTKIIKRIDVTIIVSNVNAIGSEFKNNSIINKMVIKPPVSFIQSEAFRGCISLKSVTIPSTVKTIEDSTFRICEDLENVTILANLTKIGVDAFRGMRKIKKISFPDSVCEIGESCFRGDSNLESVKLPLNLNSIDVSVFQSCVSIKEIKIPPNVKEIKASAFEECVKLSKIEIPPSVEVVRNDAFKCCVKLKFVAFDPIKTRIEKDAFSDCKFLWLLVVTTKESSCKIDIQPFPNVTEILINKNLTAIENTLPGITITDSIVYVGDDLINRIPMSGESIGNLGYDSLNNT